MTKRSKTILFFGNERLATGVTTSASTLQALIDDGYNVAAIVSNNRAARSRKQRKLEIQEVAEKHNIPTLLPKKLTQVAEQLQDYGAQAAVLVAYGKIVPDSIINIFPRGIINIHPSLLPLHRGPTPIESSILEGDKETGVSLMRLEKDMDAGPVYAQASVSLDGTETKQELADRLLELGASMVTELLPGILSGDVAALPQDESRATYDKMLTKQDGFIDWNKPATQIERQMRAYAGWPGSRTVLAGKEVTVTKAYAAPSLSPKAKPGDIKVIKEAGAVAVATKSGYLQIQKLKPRGKREMTASEFLAGYKI